MTTTYEVLYNNTRIYKKPSILFGTLGSLSKGTKIEIINISNGWAYFLYNGANAYVRTSSLKIVEVPIVKGSVKIQFLDLDSKLEISDSITYIDLALKSYTYDFRAISGYTISGNTSQTLTLTKDNPSQTITFYYNKIIGSVTIQYINIDDSTEVATKDIYSNLNLGEYTYQAKSVEGYELSSSNSIKVTLTDSSPNQTITFEYKLIINTIPDSINLNEVPYISTYFIKPIVSPTEEVVINYYITDYYHKEYVSEDYSETFTVTVRIDGRSDITEKNLKAGDHSISLGTFSSLNNQEQKFSILCTDKYGRNSHELFNFFLVRNEVPVKEYIMTSQDLATYKISNNNDISMLSSTREGLQKLLDDKQASGYNRLKLLSGTYRIDHLLPIYIPTQFTLDMNGATLKLHEFAGDSALMIELNNTFDSHVVNGTIEGDYFNHDYANSSNNSEWVHGISIGGESKYSSFDNLTIKDITGYGTINGIKNSRDNNLGYTYLYPKDIGNVFKLGDVDRNTGLDISSTNRTTSDFRDVSGYSDIGYLSVSVYLGYQGNPCGTWNLICHFYDSNKKFIRSTDAYQYRRVAVPKNASFMRVTILNEAYPTNLSIQYFRVPTHCALRNLTVDNCRCIGIAPQAMNNMIFESCIITRSGQTSSKCALDAEDGWDMMQDITFTKLNFSNNPNNEFLTCAGHNFIVENNINGNIYIWERTKNFVLRNSNCKNVFLGYSDNIVRHGVYRIYNNSISSGNVNKNICRNIKSENSITGIVYDSTMGALSSGSTYSNCIINISNSFLGYISELQMTNCKFITSKYLSTPYKISFNYSNGNKSSFENCYFYGKSILANHNGFYSSTFNSCIFDDLLIQPNVVAEETDKIIFNKCTIKSSNNYLIEYSPFNYTKGKYSYVLFNECSISNAINGSIFAYAIAKPYRGFLELINCTINYTNLKTLFDCYPSYLENLEDFNIVLKNTPLNPTVNILGDKISDNSHIKVIIS